MDEAELKTHFKAIYTEANQGGRAAPWDREGPHSHLRHWVERSAVRGDGRPAIVVGCGYGGDAAHLASLGFRTTGFDFTAEAVDEARRRHADAGLDLRVADLFALPPEWSGAFELVFESLTVQSIPPDLRAEATAAVASLVAPGGTLVVVASALDEGEFDGPPWPLYRADIDRFGDHGLEAVSIDRVGPKDRFGTDPWLAEFRRPAVG
ncbi:class I SAM-dependent methyltransferase [Microlunatus sp. GCM10028923]|uniref:class I SAM-dependent methyltransferase n=1 Tax=Microlunatus sp. GCM10028923 TaxID=3273400 RepID=UPI00361F9854